jgi:Chaperone of endosialidase
VTDLKQNQSANKKRNQTMKDRIKAHVVAALLSVTFAAESSAQNTAFTYQGRVTDNGTNFSGAGQFKFALVTSTNANHTATATADAPSGGYITGYTVVDGGNGYVTAPAVTVFGGGGSGAAATAHLTGDTVTSISVAATGDGSYTGAPTVLIAPPPPDISYTTYWSNDGTSLAGSEPTAAVNVNVSNGLVTVVLGDTTQPNMTDISAALFSQEPNLRLRIWFSDGVNGFAAISPPQNLTPAPYAVVANNLNAARVSSGILPDARLSGNVPRLDATQSFTGVNTFNNNASVTGTLSVNNLAPSSTLTVAGDMLMSGGASYHHLQLSGGNSSGFIYGSYPAFGDGIHFGYNYYADAGGIGHVINPGGGTSRISVGYGFVSLATGAKDIPPADRMVVDLYGDVGIGTTSPQSRLDVNGRIASNSGLVLTSGNGDAWSIYNNGNLVFYHGTYGPSAYISSTDGSYHQSSDLRLKRDITNLYQALDRLLKLRPVSYRLRSAPTNAPLSLGLIAQEVEPLFPEVVSEGANGMKDLAYSELVPVLIRAIQELNQKMESQIKRKDAKLATLEKQNAAMERELAEQKKTNARMAARFDHLERAVAQIAEKSGAVFAFQPTATEKQ